MLVAKTISRVVARIGAASSKCITCQKYEVAIVRAHSAKVVERLLVPGEVQCSEVIEGHIARRNEALPDR